MPQTETLHFSIDGEWLTDFARQWFWNENKPYEVVAELLGSCIAADDDNEKDTIIRDIIEGRKKFVGINEFELVNDGKNIRPIYIKINELTRKNAILRLERAIETRGIDFVDPYSTVKSISAAHDFDIVTAEKCIIWFQYSDYDQINGRLTDPYAVKLPVAEKATKAGLWLFDEPGLIYDATDHEKFHVGSTEFWDNIYELTKHRKELRERNNFYIANKRMQNGDTKTEEKTLYSHINNHLDFTTCPMIDNSLPAWSGIISPEGDFYPADFGSHETVAYHILCSKAEELGETSREYDSGAKFWNGDIGDALDTIIAKGWIAARWLATTGKYIEYQGRYDVTSKWRPTKQQKDVIWNLIGKHAENSDDVYVPEIFF